VHVPEGQHFASSTRNAQRSFFDTWKIARSRTAWLSPEGRRLVRSEQSEIPTAPTALGSVMPVLERRRSRSWLITRPLAGTRGDRGNRLRRCGALAQLAPGGDGALRPLHPAWRPSCATTPERPLTAVRGIAVNYGQ
jgi:hypothetical protein